MYSSSPNESTASRLERIGRLGDMPRLPEDEFAVDNLEQEDNEQDDLPVADEDNFQENDADPDADLDEAKNSPNAWVAAAQREPSNFAVRRHCDLNDRRGGTKCHVIATMVPKERPYLWKLEGCRGQC